MTQSRKKSPGLEDALDQLETLVNRLEHGDMSLEESLKTFEEGIRLTRQCQEKLAAAEQKVNVLLERHGEISIEPLDIDTDEDEDTDDE